MTQEGVRKVDAFTARFKVAEVSWSDAPLDPFMNVNAPEDLERAEALAAAAS